MPFLYQLDEWRCEVAFNGFSRHLLLFVASFYGFWFGCPRDLTPLYKSIIILTIAILVYQTAVICTTLMSSESETSGMGEVLYGIGYFAVLVCAIVPYIFFLDYGVASEMSFHGFYAFSYASFLFYTLFMVPNLEDLVLIVYRKHEVVSGYFCSIVQWSLVIFLSTLWYFNVWFSLCPLVCLQIMHTALHIIILSDYWIVCVLEWNREQDEDIDLDTTVDTEIIDSSDDEQLEDNECFDQEKNDLRYHDLKCGVCKLFYHESIKKRIPKMLSCGHTVCSGCAKMLHKVDYFCIQCPICREKTDIDYIQLKKNYALLGIIQEMNQDKKTVQRRHSLS
ncbi:hypothetical protein CRE_19662 [Caenorhabditis remanei]|uniref:Uncharacterized protein n=1 Tax=Caenorhabditis remanei TaxID=31234 RepID=E3MD66_CAERE|nr:hypothetical protein CRE_19662 [Caenorhabditis remanei]